MDRIATLVADLAHDDHATRLTAFHALNEAGVNPIDAARSHGKKSSLRAQVNAAAVLLVMGIDIHESLNLMTQSLGTDDAGPRFQAAFGLAVVGFVSDETVSVLVEALQTRSVAIRESAAVSLARLAWHPDTSKALPSLVNALRDDSAVVRRHAVFALARSGRDVLADLVPWLADENPSIRQQVLMLLHQHFGDRATPSLRSALKDRDANVRFAAAFYLEKTK